MERRERGFIGKLLVFILTLLAFIGLIAMAVCVTSPYINPKRFIWSAFIGLAFWEIFIFNVLVFIALLLLWSRKVWIAVLALVIAIPGFMKSYSFGSQKDTDAESNIRVMSFNIHLFNNYYDEKMSKKEFAEIVAEIVREQNPDVLCLQEFTHAIARSPFKKSIQELSEDFGLPYVSYNKRTNFGGNIIFSKYPIQGVDPESGFGKENVYGTMVSVDAGSKGIFYVASIHLTSNSITADEINVLTNTNERKTLMDTVGMSVARKLKMGFETRSDQVIEMLDGIPEVDAPILLCGDFNDTPISFTYRQIRKRGYIDTFTKSGRGIKPTYAGKLPLLRIDYIWTNDKVKPLSFKRIRKKYSDHYPIILDFKIQ